MEFYVKLENFSFTWRHHHYRWRASHFDLYTALFLRMSYLLWHRTLFIMFISEDSWHSLLFPSVWKWSCQYLFLRLRSVAARIRIPNFPKVLTDCAPAVAMSLIKTNKANMLVHMFFKNISQQSLLVYQNNLHCYLSDFFWYFEFQYATVACFK